MQQREISYLGNVNPYVDIAISSNIDDAGEFIIRRLPEEIVIARARSKYRN